MKRNELNGRHWVGDRDLCAWELILTSLEESQWLIEVVSWRNSDAKGREWDECGLDESLNNALVSKEMK